ncbi:hypothetical protein ABZ479_19480 [Streptomyces sp. NPDC005722]
MNGPLPASGGSGGSTDGTLVVVPLWRAPLAGQGVRTESRPNTRTDRQDFRAVR